MALVDFSKTMEFFLQLFRISSSVMGQNKNIVRTEGNTGGVYS